MKLKEQTIEQASEYYAHNYFDMHETNNYKALKEGFIAGAKWQQKKQDIFAIEFADWCIKNNLVEYYVLSILYKTDYKYSIEELLETFKKEKGL